MQPRWLLLLLIVCSIRETIFFLTITAEIHACTLANFYCQYADRQMNLKFMRRVSKGDRVI